MHQSRFNLPFVLIKGGNAASCVSEETWCRAASKAGIEMKVEMDPL
jgi:hypothetical protein